MWACSRRLTAFRLRILWRYRRLYSLPCLLSSNLQRSRDALSDGFEGPIWMFHCRLWARERRLCRIFDAIQPKKVYKKCGLKIYDFSNPYNNLIFIFLHLLSGKKVFSNVIIDLFERFCKNFSSRKIYIIFN